MAYQSIHRTTGLTKPMIRTASEIRQPPRPGSHFSPVSPPKLRSYYLNDSKLSIIAERSRLNGGCVLEETTSYQNLPQIKCLTLVVVSYGTASSRLIACQRALDRLDHANPAPGRKIFLEAGSTLYEYLRDRGWEYHHYDMNENMEGLFQKEPLWTIGTKLAFDDLNTDDVVLIDADCAFHDNSWAYMIHKSLLQYGFVQPYAAIFYSEQKDRGMNTGTIPTIAYCMQTHQEHPYAVPGGAYACTRYFFEHILNHTWPINPVGSGDVQFWQYLYGRAPVINRKVTRDSEVIGRFQSYQVGYTSLLLNHYYHGPMSNRMYTTRAYIADRCITGSETILNRDGLLEWADNKIGKVMKRSMKELKQNVDNYNQVGRSFTIMDTKSMFKRICREELGTMGQDQKLLIVTSYKQYGVYSKEQIASLREAVKRTFQCPYTFKVATNDPDWNPVEKIYCDIPSYYIPFGYEWIMATSIADENNISILYLDPSVKLTGTCDIIPCTDDAAYLSYTGKQWSTKIIYFKRLTVIYQTFLKDIKNNEYDPSKLFPDPASYFISVLTSSTVWKLRDVLFYLDYESMTKEMARTTNIII